MEESYRALHPLVTIAWWIMTINSADEFVRLRYSTDPEEYRRAANEDAPLEVWKDVITRYPDARMWVAQNKTVPLEILASLVSDPDARVRTIVAMKRKLTPELLDQLARDDDDSVRLHVATHKNTSRNTLSRLLEDPWENVRNAADERLKASLFCYSKSQVTEEKHVARAALHESLQVSRGQR
jgi:hypothetical protein